MPRQGRLIQRLIIQHLGGFYNDLIGRRSHLGAAAVIFDQMGRVLLVRQTYGRRGWELPGGGRRSRESLDAAVRREVREEIGVEVSSAELCGVYYEPGVDQHHFAFRCELVAGVEPSPSSPEILDCAYYALEALPRPMTDFTLQRITDAQRRTKPITITVLGPRRWFE
jgi:8-oxo-dGTP diphosphatase